MDHAEQQTEPQVKDGASIVGDSQTGDVAETTTEQFVVFGLDKEEYAVPITDVREIVKVADVTPVPNAPSYVKGILNLRGDIVVIVDLEARFNLKREHQSTSSHVIVLDIDGSSFGLLVDEVKEVVKVPIGSIKETPSLVSSKIKIDYLKGVTVLSGNNKENETVEDGKAEVQDADSRLLIILDAKRMLNEKEMVEVESTVKKDVDKRPVEKSAEIINNTSNK